MRLLVHNSIDKKEDRDELITIANEMQDSVVSSTFIEKYQTFISLAANHMTALGPIIPALTNLISK